MGFQITIKISFKFCRFNIKMGTPSGEFDRNSIEQGLVNLGFEYEFITRLQAYYHFNDLDVALEYAIKGN